MEIYSSKKLINILVISSLMTLASYSLSLAQAFKGSFIAGPTFNQVNRDSLVGFDKLGFFAGASVSTPLSKSFYVQFDILYNQKGAKSPVDTSTSGTTLPQTNLQLNYIEIPLQLYWNFNKNLFMHSGFYYGILSNATYDDGAIEVDITNSFHPYDIGVIYGIEYALFEKLNIEARFSTSMFNMRKFGPGNQFNVNALFGVRYVFQSR